VGNIQNDFSNTTYSTLMDHKIYLYDANKFSGTKTIYFEATLHTDNSGNTVSAQLLQCTSSSNCSTGSAVSGSELTHTGDTSWTRERTASEITLTDDANFAVQVKMSAGTGDIANAKIIIGQTAAGGLTDIELVHEYVNTLATDSDITYTDQDYLDQYDPTNSFLGGTFTKYFEATLKGSTGTGSVYAILKNDTDGTTISGSEISTGNTSYTRVRSGDITSNMPSSAKNMDTQLKNLEVAGGTTSAADSWLIIQVSNLQIPENLLFVIPLAVFIPVVLRKRFKVKLAFLGLSNWCQVMQKERLMVREVFQEGSSDGG